MRDVWETCGRRGRGVKGKRHRKHAHAHIPHTSMHIPHTSRHRKHHTLACTLACIQACTPACTPAGSAHMGSHACRMDGKHARITSMHTSMHVCMLVCVLVRIYIYMHAGWNSPCVESPIIGSHCSAPSGLTMHQPHSTPHRKLIAHDPQTS